MGIKGVYGEIGGGTRTALLKLAVETKEQEQRNLRIAIDFSIWQHQVQLGRGGTNADLRTLFYRSLRLLRLSIEPLFVFDGPHKPPFKRNKKTNQSGGSALQLAAIELFKLLGFPYITAPGEAEAECAVLQKEGLVDAVLSEDVDTLMFGCTTHLRAWGPENQKSKGTATHVDVYRAEEIKLGPSGLDRDGMVLIALMSGGDYLPAGIPNCGIKTACEAARAGFGSELASIDRKDTLGIRAWREKLQHELHTNESKFFRIKHKALKIPENFPDKAVLYYYRNPVVSTSEQIAKYRTELRWQEPNVRKFWKACGTFFDWHGPDGLRHFTRNLAPALVGWRLANGFHEARPCGDVDVQSSIEETLIKTISGQRNHSSADKVPEIRLSYIPSDIVGLRPDDLAEAQLSNPQSHTAEYSGEEDEHESGQLDAANDDVIGTISRKRITLPYDPTKLEKDWFPEAIAKIGIPLTYQKWSAELQDPKKFASRKARARQKENEAMPQGAIEKYFSVAKPVAKSLKSNMQEQVKKVDAPRITNVLSKLPTSSDHSLTSTVTPTTTSAATKRKSLQRPKPSLNKNAQTTSALIGHVRVTKPNIGLRSPVDSAIGRKLSPQEEFIDLEMLLSQPKLSANIDWIRPQLDKAQSTQYDSLNHDTSKDVAIEKEIQGSTVGNTAFATSNDPDGIPITSSSQSLELVQVSFEVDSGRDSEDVSKASKQRSPFTRTISAPVQNTNFRPRPTYNQWRYIDDLDTSSEDFRTPKKKEAIVVDLTLT